MKYIEEMNVSFMPFEVSPFSANLPRAVMLFSIYFSFHVCLHSTWDFIYFIYGNVAAIYNLHSNVNSKHMISFNAEDILRRSTYARYFYKLVELFLHASKVDLFLERLLLLYIFLNWISFLSFYFIFILFFLFLFYSILFAFWGFKFAFLRVNFINFIVEAL